MIIFVIDISGRVSNYDVALCDAATKAIGEGDKLILMCPLYEFKGHSRLGRLLNFIPRKYRSSEKKWKRFIKLIEVTINYLIVLFKVLWIKPNIVHFQWFPLLEFALLEYYVVKSMRCFSKKTKIVLTIHNIYPHNIPEVNKKKYKVRFIKIASLIDSFIVHTNESKKSVVNEFLLKTHKVSVIHHGIFIPHDFEPKINSVKQDNLTFIMYGSMSGYKGVDLFVEAFKILPEGYKTRAHGIIAGAINDNKLKDYINKEINGLNIDYYPYFLPEQELYEKIDNSNVIVLPYRQISQSGVLLLALHFRRYIITSDLPAFKETLEGFTDDMFFENGNADSLCQLMIKYLDGQINTTHELMVIEKLNKQYSWEKAGTQTIGLYNSLL